MKTRDYSIFKYMSSNRRINNGLVDRLVKSINEIGYIEARPVLVSDDMTVIDGQHRIEACKILRLPIVYEISNVDKQRAMISLNMTQQIWRIKEYIESWAIRGVKTHVELKKFMDRYKLSDTTAILVCLCRNDSYTFAKIRSGADVPLFKHRYEIVTFISECKKHLSFCEKRSFVGAACTLFKVANDDQIVKIFKHIPTITEQPTVTHYLTLFENIINKRVRNESEKIILRNLK